MDWIMILMGLLALLVGASSFWLHRRRNRSDAGRSLDETLTACRALLALIAHFQQHRGMSSAWLAGDQGFKQRLEGKGREIEACIPSLRDIARREGERVHPCLTLNDLDLFRFNWANLHEKLPGLSVEQSIAQHSFLIEQLLHWLAALGESRVELLLDAPAARGLVRNYASRLPALTECLGQARALGMSVAARHGCSAVVRVRLMFLVARAEALLKQASEAGGEGAVADKATRGVQQMARVIRTQMLLSSGITVAAQEYFEVASGAIDHVFAWIGDSGVQLKQAGSGYSHVSQSLHPRRA